MNIEKALEKLYSMKQMGVKLGLDNINKLLAYIGNPQNKLKCFHVAGSNGKGSTSSFLASMLTEAGYKTGLYTSPHLVNFNERIRINGIEIEDSYIAAFIDELENYIKEEEPTFFEITTALAFRYFADHNTDYCVIETGLGGRLDATNTITPVASVITSISLEHTRILGDTLEKIAAEKGGIIKDNTPLFIGKLPDSAKEVLVKIAGEKKSPLYDLTKYVKFEGKSAVINSKNKNYNIYSIPLKGWYQYYNASLAALTLSETINLKPDAVFRGIKNVLTNSGLQGRFEIYNREPLVVFDSGHNTEGISSFVEELKEIPGTGKPLTLIYGAMADKDIDSIAKILKNKFDRILVTTINFERAASIMYLQDVFNQNGITTEPLENPALFIQEFIQQNKTGTLIILGSIYVLGDIRSKLTTQKNLDI